MAGSRRTMSLVGARPIVTVAFDSVNSCVALSGPSRTSRVSSVTSRSYLERTSTARLWAEPAAGLEAAGSLVQVHRERRLGARLLAADPELHGDGIGTAHQRQGGVEEIVGEPARDVDPPEAHRNRLGDVGDAVPHERRIPEDVARLEDGFVPIDQAIERARVVVGIAEVHARLPVDAAL